MHTNRNIISPMVCIHSNFVDFTPSTCPPSTPSHQIALQMEGRLLFTRNKCLKTIGAYIAPRSAYFPGVDVTSRFYCRHSYIYIGPKQYSYNPPVLSILSKSNSLNFRQRRNIPLVRITQESSNNSKSPDVNRSLTRSSTTPNSCLPAHNGVSKEANRLEIKPFYAKWPHVHMPPLRIQ